MKSSACPHTPGPWHYCIGHCNHTGAESSLLNTESELLGSIHTSDGACIIDAVWHNDSTAGLYGIEANARLIAAAPELLAELEHAHDMIKHYLKCGYLPHMSAEEAEQLVRNPDSAIRKARGEQ